MGEGRFAQKLAIIGGGRMGEAIAGGLLDADAMDATSIVFAEPVAERRQALEDLYGVAATADASAAVIGADMVLLAVKPQVIDDVVASLAAGVTGTVVSIAAGISTARLESLLPAGTPVVRVMPNTPMLVGQGTAIVSGGSDATDEHVEAVQGIFAEIGYSVVLEEKYQDAATAISGCGPAYFALVIDALARAGVRHGLTREVAQKLALTTMRGTADLIEQTCAHPQEVIDAVTSPGGSTIAALEAMERAGIRTAVADGVCAAVKRSKELGS